MNKLNEAIDNYNQELKNAIRNETHEEELIDRYVKQQFIQGVSNSALKLGIYEERIFC